MYWEFPHTNVRILGSMHLLPADNAGLPRWAIEAFDWADVLVFESDPPTIHPFLFSPTPTGLQCKLTPGAWKTLCGLWPTTGTMPSIEEARPWAVLLMSSIFSQRIEQGIESHFMQWAKEQSKPVQFLETAEQVAAAFDSVPNEQVIQALELLASDLSASQRSLETMYRAWMQKDLQGLFDIANQSPMFHFSGFRDAVLDRRNQEWSPSVRDLMDSPQKTLVAVGALHLYGIGNLFEHIGRSAELILAEGE